MQLKIKRNKLVFGFCYFIVLLYVLMRPFLINYLFPQIKYIFLLIILLGLFVTFCTRKYIHEIGNKELLFLIISYVYILLNAYFIGGAELLTLSITSYILYTFPIIVFPLIKNKVDFIKLLKFLSWFGLVDAGISIIEFITRKQMFPMSGVEGEVGTVTKAGAYIVRTYGLQGSYFILAEVLCFCGCAAFYLYRFQKDRIYFFIWVIISIGILTTGSRGYYVSYFVGLVAMYLCESLFEPSKKKNYKKVLSIFGMLIILVLILYFVLHSDFLTGNNDIDVVLRRIRMIADWEGDSANVRRVQVWNWAIKYWKESILVGHGACSTDLRYSGYINVTESGVLKRLVELGIIGTILQYITMIIPIKRGIRNIKKRKLHSSALVFIGTVVAFMIEDFVLERYTSPEYTIILWFSIAYLAYTQSDVNPYQTRSDG